MIGSGMLIAASNGSNQIIERDLDKLMTRTMIDLCLREECLLLKP